MEINLQSVDIPVFLSYLSRCAGSPIPVIIHQGRLRLTNAETGQAAAALACGVFPARERRLLLRMSAEISRERDLRRRLTVLTQILAEEDIPRFPLYQGRHRQQSLTEAICPLLEQTFSLEGFCRFRLPGYEAYLRELLCRSRDLLEQKAEDERCLELLRQKLSQGRGVPEMEFTPEGFCHLRRSDGSREGCRLQDAEWLIPWELLRQDPERIIIRNKTFMPPALSDMLHGLFGKKLYPQRQQ